MAAVSAPPAPVLEAAAKKLAEETDPHPRIYEMPPDKGRACGTESRRATRSGVRRHRPAV
jgi:hypothetical protein